MKISIFGLGYVGCVCGACLAELGHTVVGVDLNKTKVDLLNEGKSPIVEPGLSEMISRLASEGRLRATTDAAEAVRASSLALICVGTPSRPNGSLDTSHVKKVAVDIGRALREKVGYFVVAVRSTMLPGTVDEVVIRTLEEVSGRSAESDFGVCVNPEFLRESTAIEDFYHPAKIVIGESDPRAGEVVAAVYAGIDAPLFRTDMRVAEMAKYSDNAFHALKVTFANEIGRVCKELSIDSHKVMEIFCADRKLNISATYLRPGFAFGGSCLPKDLRALTYEAAYIDVETPLLNAIIPSNARHVNAVGRVLLQYRDQKVGFLGLAFKGGTDDLRESPIVELIELLIGKGLSVKIYDRNVNLGRLTGVNKEYVDRAIPHLARLMCDEGEEIIRTCDVVVVGNRSEEYPDLLSRMRPDQLLVDLVRVVDRPEAVAAEYYGIGW